MAAVCSNCNSTLSLELSNTDETHQRAAMSDGRIVADFCASHHLCRNCGAMFTVYQPENRLRRYFAEEYDVSDTVQNCQVVIDNQQLGKHSVIHENLLRETNKLPNTGSMLEIACGEGDLTRKFARANPNWSCLGIDPSVSAHLDSTQGNLKFIRNFFSVDEVKNNKFDVIVAHGILNRTPTLKMLEEISLVANDGALVSVEIVTLENSYYAPYIWDHSYTFLEETFEQYLNHFGFKLEKKYDCGSTVQFVARFKKKECSIAKFVTSRTIVEKTHQLYSQHQQTWSSINEKHNAHKERPVALFGAGLYSAVLMNLVGEKNIDYVVDEFRAGSKFGQHKVIGLGELMRDATILLCCRERNINYIIEKLIRQNIRVKSLLDT
jgi:ubiquinone/menaquinone biosynthesis C-methylase UbiE